MKHLSPLFVILLLLAAPLAAHADKVDDYVQATMKRQHIPGLSLAVVKDGKVIKAKGYGVANVELNAPATPNTVYKLASISKQFVATGIMLLVEDGKVSLDDKITKYLDGLPDACRDITVRQLLSHTSGLVREVPGWSPLREFTDAEIVKAVHQASLVFQPGAKWQYCNLGYFLLGMIIQKASGKTWGAFLKERVFDPLDMTATRVVSNGDVIPQRADGYLYENDGLHNDGVILMARPSGELLSNVLDLAKWDAALYTEKILKQSSLAEMWTPVKLNGGTTHPYGLGWGLGEQRGHKLVQHGGSLGGFRTQISRYVDDKLTVIVLTNCSAASPEIIAQGVARRYMKDLVEKPIEDKDPQTTMQLKGVLVALREGTLDPETFTVEARATLFPDRTKHAHEILKDLGRLRSFELLERRDEGATSRFRYRVRFKREAWIFAIVRNADGKIAAMNVMPE